MLCYEHTRWIFECSRSGWRAFQACDWPNFSGDCLFLTRWNVWNLGPLSQAIVETCAVGGSQWLMQFQYGMWGQSSL